MRVTVPSLAKVNLDLRVLHQRPDGYHEVRTIFQTISLRDTLTIEFEAKKQTQIDLESSLDIPDNLVVRSAKLLLDTLRVTGRVRIALEKRIPMGAGLGGGSSNAAATLIALSALIRKSLPETEFASLSARLGSDVPFFLHGGTALGLGRGTELYPLPDLRAHHGVVIDTGIHVSTAEAYQGLNRTLTQPGDFPILGEFQKVAWSLERAGSVGVRLKNDFEDSVFEAHPKIAGSVRKLQRLGARPALMTGSGSAVFGIFPGADAALRAAASFPVGTAFPMRFVTRRHYARTWRRSLGDAAKRSIFRLTEEI